MMKAGKETFKVFFNELEDECLETVKLLEAFKISTLTPEEKENLLGDLSVSISSLRIKTELLEKDLEELDEIAL